MIEKFGQDSFQGIDPYDWEQALVTDMVLDYSQISEEVPTNESLKQQKQMVRPQVQEILQEEVRKIEIAQESILKQLETPQRQSKSAHYFPDDLDVFDEGISFIGDKKISDDEVRGVDINRLGQDNLPGKCLQQQVCSEMIRSLIDDFLGQNACSNQKGSSLLDQSVSQVSSRKIDSEQEQGKSLSKKLKVAEKQSVKKVRGRCSKNRF